MASPILLQIDGREVTPLPLRRRDLSGTSRNCAETRRDLPLHRTDRLPQDPMTRQTTIRSAFQTSLLFERALGLVLWTGLIAVLFTKSYL